MKKVLINFCENLKPNLEAALNKQLVLQYGINKFGAFIVLHKRCNNEDTVSESCITESEMKDLIGVDYSQPFALNIFDSKKNRVVIIQPAEEKHWNEKQVDYYSKFLSEYFTK